MIQYDYNYKYLSEKTNEMELNYGDKVTKLKVVRCITYIFEVFIN